MRETLARPVLQEPTRTGLERWLDAYGAAWEARDGDAAAELFADEARYHWGPFEPPLEGRTAIAERWSAATSGQRDIHFEHTPLGIADGLAFVHWRSSFVRLATLEDVTLDGIFVLRFEADGLCSELREWWLGT